MFDRPTALPGIIDRDASCGGCGYNLRGLDPAGRCPECGRSVAVTLATIDAVAGRDRLSSAGLASLGEWGEALTFVLIGAGMTMAVGLAPAFIERPHSVGRQCLLAAAVTGWVATGLGLWKAARADPAIDTTWWRKFGAVVLRGSALTYTLLPALVVLNLYQPAQLVYRFGIALVVVGSIAAVAFQIRLWQLAVAAGRSAVARQCAFLAVLVPVCVAVLGLQAEPSELPSLDVLLVLPSPACGSAWICTFLARYPWLLIRRWWLFALVAVPAWELTVAALLLWSVRRAATQAASRGSTAPSSRPSCR